MTAMVETTAVMPAAASHFGMAPTTGVGMVTCLTVEGDNDHHEDTFMGSMEIEGS